MPPLARRWTGRSLSTMAVLFLLFDAVIKFFRIPAVSEAFGQLGYPMTLAVTIGIIEVVCLVLYIWPRTSLLGALLWTGYLGGAIATHVRVGNPLFSDVLFPIYVAAFLWGGLYLRNEDLRVFLNLQISKSRNL